MIKSSCVKFFADGAEDVYDVLTGFRMVEVVVELYVFLDEFP